MTEQKIKPEIAAYVPMADMLVRTFGEDCEVVLHDLAEPQHSVVYVANSRVTGRKIGESFDQLVKQVILSDALKENYVANYYFNTKDGRRIRSSSLLIRDRAGKLTGALCINLDTTRLTQQIEFLQSFLPQSPLVTKEDSSQAEGNEVEAMVVSLIDNILAGCDINTMSREERIAKVRFMEDKGIFLMKGSMEQVADKLGVTKVTVYSYLDEVRGRRG
jgi:predicted transcriptional regulator YheO